MSDYKIFANHAHVFPKGSKDNAQLENLKELMAELTTEADETRQVELLTKISDFNKARTRLNNELGRV